MTPSPLHVIIPGLLDQRTGGYLYNARMVEGLRRLGWRVRVHELEGVFPGPDSVAREALRAVLESLPDGSRVLIDGLAMGGVPEPVSTHGNRLRLVSLVHHPLAEETGLSPAAERRFEESEREGLRACVGVIVTSGFTARRLETYEVPRERIRVVSPGTEPAPAARGPSAGSPPLLLCVASVTPRKGHQVLVAALESIRDLSWTCVCAGSLDRDPEHARAVVSQVADAGLGDRIDFVGEKDARALDGLYDVSSIFVLASHYEGYGMAFAEALARGLPIVGTSGGAVPFTVPADAALLVPPGDAVAFAEALRELLAGPGALREALAVAARARALELPDWPDSARAFAVAVDELTGEP